MMSLNACCLALMVECVAAGPLVGPGLDDFARATGQVIDRRRTLNYELFLPPAHTEQPALPLVVYLHGSTDGQPSKQQRLNDTMRGLVHTTQRDNATRGVRDPKLAASFDEQFAAYLLVPKIASGGGWSNHLDMVLDLMHNLDQHYSFDPRRFYLTGFSDGGFATIDMIKRYPNLFAAGVPISGGGFVATADIDALSQVPLWFFHGSDDFTVDPRFSVDLYRAIVAAGGNARLSLPFGGHNAGYETAFRDRAQEFYPWLFRQMIPVPEPTDNLSALAALVMLVTCGRSRLVTRVQGKRAFQFGGRQLSAVQQHAVAQR